MNESQFWNLIDSSRRRAKSDIEAHAAALESALAKLPPAEIISFYRVLHRHWVKAYTWNLWAAAYTISDGCSDDGFMYFRCWLVSKGQKVYENALSDPESLAPHVKKGGACFAECFLAVAQRAWAKKTGSDELDFPAPGRHPTQPKGKRWNVDDLSKLVPKLWKKFGE